MTSVLRFVSMARASSCPRNSECRTMISSRSGKTIVSVLFLFFFVIYAISPLMGTFPEKKGGESSHTSRDHASRPTSIHVFLVDLLIGMISCREETPQDHPNDTILVRKKRALIPKNAVAKLLPSEQPSILKGPCHPPLQTTYRSREPHAGLRGARTGFHSLYACHSPPTA